MSLFHIVNRDAIPEGGGTDPNATSLQVMSSIRGDVRLSYCSKNTLLSCDGGTEASQFYMLRYHRDRMHDAAKDLGWTEAGKILEGWQGLNRLRDILQNQFSKMSNENQNSYPQKVPTSAASLRQFLTDNASSCASLSIVKAISPSRRRHFRRCLCHHCRRRIFHWCCHNFRLLSTTQLLIWAGEYSSLLFPCLHRSTLATRPPSDQFTRRQDRSS